MKEYVKRPVVIEAVQYTDKNREEIVQLIKNNDPIFTTFGNTLKIRTLEGAMQVNPGDWIIKGIKGEFYPCKPNIFEASYDEVAKSE